MFSIYIWIAIQDLHKKVEDTPNELPTMDNYSADSVYEASSTITDQDSVQVDVSKPVIISISSLPPSQQTILEKLGYTDSIAITGEMQKCVREQIGSTRFHEILGGMTPSAKEIFMISPCLAK